jgi:hypothetical protein
MMTQHEAFFSPAQTNAALLNKTKPRRSDVPFFGIDWLGNGMSPGASGGRRFANRRPELAIFRP